MKSINKYMPMVLLSCIILDGTQNHLEMTKVSDIGVVMLKYGRRVEILLVGGFVWLEFDAWG